MIWSELRHFKPDEFTVPHMMEDDLLRRLDRVRTTAGVPIVITSSFRDGDPKSHGRGYAVDISDNADGAPCSSRWRAKVLPAALSYFDRIGVYDRHIHVDSDPSLPPNVVWWGKSQ